MQSAERDGSADPSPNAGRSEAIYAHCIRIQLGGENRYGAVSYAHLTLPLVCPPWTQWAQRVQAAERDGSADPSPNAGRSEAIYAHCIGIQLGGNNRYGERLVQKPVLGAGQPTANAQLVRAVLKASIRLEVLWLITIAIIELALAAQ